MLPIFIYKIIKAKKKKRQRDQNAMSFIKTEFIDHNERLDDYEYDENEYKDEKNESLTEKSVVINIIEYDDKKESNFKKNLLNVKKDLSSKDVEIFEKFDLPEIDTDKNDNYIEEFDGYDELSYCENQEIIDEFDKIKKNEKMPSNEFDDDIIEIFEDLEEQTLLDNDNNITEIPDEIDIEYSMLGARNIYKDEKKCT